MSIPEIDDWLESPPGRYVMAWEQDKIDTVVADLDHYDAGERSTDLGQLAALPVALLKADHVGQ